MQHVVHLSLYHHVPLNTVSNIHVYGIYHLTCTAVILTYRKPPVGTAIGEPKPNLQIGNYLKLD